MAQKEHEKFTTLEMNLWKSKRDMKMVPPMETNGHYLLNVMMNLQYIFNSTRA